MGFCKNHPDRQTQYYCQKQGYYLCESCLKCNDPHIYCKYRTSCIIYFITEKSDEPLDTAVQSTSEKHEREEANE